MKDDPRTKALLAVYKDAASPSDVALRRGWNATATRIEAGDPGLPIDVRPAAGPTALPVAWLAGALVLGAVATGVVTWALRGAPSTEENAPAAARQSPHEPPPRPASPPPAVQAAAVAGPACDGLGEPYVLPDHLVPFEAPEGRWRHPWRAYLESRPAQAFVNGIGVHLNDGVPARSGAEEVRWLELLARNGVSTLHLEIGWDHIDYSDDSRLRDEARIVRLLSTARRFGLRPVIRVFSHEAAPCPQRTSQRRVAAPARAGDRTLVLADGRGLIAGQSGLSRLSSRRSAEILFTSVDGGRVTLSRPLPFDLPQGAQVRVTTLKYRPFAAPGSAGFEETLAGWLRFVNRVAEVATAALGTRGAADVGFDLEIGQSTTFAASFLALGRYGDAWTDALDVRATAREIVARTALHADGAPSLFSGARLVDGFAGTDLAASSGAEPPRVSGLARRTPGSLRRLWSPFEANADGAALADWLPVGADTGLASAERLAFPELEATALSGQDFVRDLAPVATRAGTGNHGRLVRGPEIPGCDVWLVGPGIDPRLFAPDMPKDRADSVSAKIVARQYAFFLHKGAAAVALHAWPVRASFGVHGAGLLQRRDDGAVVATPALVALGRMQRALREATGPADPGAGRSVTVLSVRDCHGHVQIPARGGRPPLRNRDQLVLLPFQVNPRRIVVAYYVMTLDTTVDLAPESYDLVLGGVGPPAAQVRASAYDPVRDLPVPVIAPEPTGGDLHVTVEATDAPRLLVLDIEKP